MSSQILNQIIERVDLLTEAEINQLNHYLKTKVFIKKGKHKWQSIRGMLNLSENTEDAQITLSNLRKSADNKREQQWQK